MEKNIIQKEDVLQVANDLNINVNESICLWVIMNYGEYQDKDPSATWNLVVEQMLYDIPKELRIKKEEYGFYLEQKVTTWMRTYYTIEGETKEEAIKEAIKFVKDGKCEPISWEEVEGVTEPMDITDNDGYSTKEIYFEDGTIIYQNSNDGI